ncbi:hypothetical protein HN695_07610 [Candidatus Woesearchaeota archaeon]|jgi:hypothetical protein|nr:hypothetical protein [Candidatus Woesearchaeota archaeon]MBT5272636.1 hypothetical protein [Candidatus Woesearchaeota archaeon]MBT6041727.1 hypothetical protein [Candidatus Woesearchaeota archaeon]MBT6337188.1 hypothetical protein [Candidatus Woesearchaeota archaeon]MBT7928174.1 hypothetical protein [Candidatus Woesearchaeota archaeon]
MKKIFAIMLLLFVVAFVGCQTFSPDNDGEPAMREETDVQPVEGLSETQETTQDLEEVETLEDDFSDEELDEIDGDLDELENLDW